MSLRLILITSCYALWAANCFAQLPAGWTSVTPTPSPAPAQSSSMAYDIARGETVLFTRNAGNPETWVWNGVTWTQRDVLGSPVARTSALMAYDATRNYTLLFGGVSGGTFQSDTWTWNGSNWTAVFPPPTSNPIPGRAGSAMVYDSNRGRVVLFGGLSSSGTVLNDMWEWTGVSWNQITPATLPPARQRHAMALDTARNRVVLFGGRNQSNTVLSDTWEWDGTNWTQMMPNASPPATDGHAMAYDGYRRLIILAGPSQTWGWSGTQWSTVATQTPFPARTDFPMVYDQSHAQLVAFGGVQSSTALGDTELLTSLTRADFNVNGKPDVLWQNDATRQVSVWYLGGAQGNTLVSDAWLAQNGPQGWRVVGIADFNGDNRPDVVWQNDATRQVSVWYLGGAQGNTLVSDAWLAQNGPQGWRVVGIADFNSDGKPDLVWQNDNTRQVAVWYMGGAQGNTYQGDAWLAQNGPLGWSVAAVADFNADGKPDLVWQNDTSRQASIWYMGGGQGNAFVSDAWLAQNGPQGWRVTRAADINGDGKPDVLWQSDTTRQVSVWYMGGTQGNTFVRDAWLAQSGPQGWTPILQ